ncbi:putative ABC exporter domain-containing protein [Clostridium cibarium]|uniref:ABC exporter domain-containing protein n=1 Tax=Clostridium cibarium TaxID=2762247 RepID=A0ABR8PYU5_9CLOT|nr:putative ABC exporter domain-containing protein [Clostridium cibarium]MBD7913284.1 putative ABC exporter domain-containing protein [Clostridium cibarium]
MSLFIYLLKRNSINYIKSIKHKPSRIVPFIFYGFFIFLMILGSIKGSSNNSFVESRYFTGILTIVLILIFMYTLYSGVTRKNFRYTMSDVNIIFTSPIKSQNVLLYGFIKEISFVFAFSIILLFQIPNLSNKFDFVNGGIVIFVVLILLFFIILSSISLLIYGIFSKYSNLKEIAIKVIKYGSLLIFLSLSYYIYTHSNGNKFQFSIEFFNMNGFNYIPIIGWTRAAIIQCLNGFNISIALYVGLLILTGIICITILYNFNLDFYEDALPSAEQNEVAQSYRNSGFNSKELNKLQGTRKPFARRNAKLNYSALYSKAIFFRHMLEYKKSGYYFLNILSGIYLIASIAVGLYLSVPLYGFLLFSIYMMVISSYTGKWSLDLSSHFIFLIPASSASKLFYSTLSSLIKYFVDGMILFIPCGIIMGSDPIEVIFSILAYTSFGAISIYGSVLNYKLFDKVSNQMMKGIFMLITLIVYVLPGVVIGALLSFKFKIFGPYALHLSFILYNIIASLIIVQAAKGIYDTLES